MWRRITENDDIYQYVLKKKNVNKRNKYKLIMLNIKAINMLLGISWMENQIWKKLMKDGETKILKSPNQHTRNI